MNRPGSRSGSLPALAVLIPACAKSTSLPPPEIPTADRARSAADHRRRGLDRATSSDQDCVDWPADIAALNDH
jgi:hypothetical protein